jgi:8-oxo-dGTP diphosphatase
MFESFEQAALRELAEEAGPVTVRQPRFWTCVNTRFYNEDKHYVVILLVADWLSGEPVVKEPKKCEEWRWCDWDHLPSPLMQGLQTIKDLGLALPS